MRSNIRVANLLLMMSLFLCFSGCGGGSGTIVQPTVSSIAISPTDVNVGQKQQLVATATYSNGSSQPITPGTWSSSNPQALTVSSTGIATGVAYGQSTVSASYSGVAGNAVLKVHGGALSITVTGSVTGTVTITGPGGFTASISTSQTLQVPPGAYTITGNPAASGNSKYWPSIQSQAITVPDGGSASATVDYSTIIPNTTKVLDAAGIEQI